MASAFHQPVVDHVERIWLPNRIWSWYTRTKHSRILLEIDSGRTWRDHETQNLSHPAQDGLTARSNENFSRALNTQGWPVWQIVAVVASFAVIVIVFIVALFICIRYVIKRHNRRQRYSSSRSHRFLGIWPRVKHVRSGHRVNNWSIDGLDGLGEFETAEPTSPGYDSSGHIRLSSSSSSYGRAPSTTDSGTRTRISNRWTTFWDNALHWNPFRTRPIPVVSTQPYPSFRISGGPRPGHVRLSSSGSATLAEGQLKQSYSSLDSFRSLPKRMLMGGASWIGSWGEIFKRKRNPDIPRSQGLAFPSGGFGRPEGADDDFTMPNVPHYPEGSRGEFDDGFESVYLISSSSGGKFPTEWGRNVNGAAPSRIPQNSVPEIPDAGDENLRFNLPNPQYSVENLGRARSPSTPHPPFVGDLPGRPPEPPNDPIHSEDFPLGEQHLNRGVFEENTLSGRDPYKIFVRPSRSDPTLLFPGAVRAAGYIGVPEI